jgi:ubiquinone biosynthesis monooxygenase Coq7
MSSNRHLRRILSQILRIDHSGEFGASFIYSGQLKVLRNDLEIREMKQEEDRHLKIFTKILPATRTRPSLLVNLWGKLGFMLGKTTALMSREQAMLCTEAVETVISIHYNDQIRDLLQLQGLNEKEQDLVKQIVKILKEFRDEEENHKSIASKVTTDSLLNRTLSLGIQTGCKVAISIAKVI